MSDPNPEKLEALAGKVVTDASAALCALLTYMADDSGIFKAMADGEARSAQDIAADTQVDTRYLQELLSALAASGYVNYFADSEQFQLDSEQAALFAVEGQPTSMQGIFQVIVAQFAEYEAAMEELKSGRGRPWSSHHSCQFCGTDRFFRPGYEANLLDNWIPALDGVRDKLERGAQIADIGCGHGSSSLLMAQRFPASQVNGFDLHPGSINDARAKSQGVENLSFAVSDASAIPSDAGYDFACIFDALHDMGDPVGVASHIRSCLKPDGTLMVVEPMASDSPAENMHPLGALFYAASTLVCLPNSRSQEVGLCLGAQAGPRRLTEVLQQAGFSQVRMATSTATNMVLEARP